MGNSQWNREGEYIGMTFVFNPFLTYGIFHLDRNDKVGIVHDGKTK